MTSDKFIRDYIDKGLLKRDRIGFDQMNKVIARAKKDLEAAKRIIEIDPPLAYNCAYDAMLHSARAFVFMKGLRPTTNYQHKTVVEVTKHFLGDDYKVLVEKFDRMRKNRNLIMYEPWKVNISDTDAQNALKSAGDFIELIIELIKKENPQIEFKF
ncbi:MAG: HEPN domain-containing protein [Candidatus Omnitrophica bacterium]|nr:HEPN domain-containing protein [Candidatus Omnitrophota bacterium]